MQRRDYPTLLTNEDQWRGCLREKKKKKKSRPGTDFLQVKISKASFLPFLRVIAYLFISVLLCHHLHTYTCSHFSFSLSVYCIINKVVYCTKYLLKKYRIRLLAALLGPPRDSVYP
ncbi:uncharacterized protein F4812DRAFT_48126 [Daldinia caldariorum]|uniref:uncharacterized protein n=1 Tax=Daldinia caldariorum TaxID=326644 RepID=UPI002008E2B1|nr:uncharacterized protein F4812DRAFT_48126 [Daldinia caldariorum]KAI1467075.1 hypothetical protein F4812DRAFT_48126 [Daldinia caldariorum]